MQLWAGWGGGGGGGGNVQYGYIVVKFCIIFKILHMIFTWGYIPSRVIENAYCEVVGGSELCHESAETCGCGGGLGLIDDRC